MKRLAAIAAAVCLSGLLAPAPPDSSAERDAPPQPASPTATSTVPLVWHVETAEGEPVSASIGRFGPYVRFGNKFASLTQDDDPYTIELPRALELIEAKKKADASKEIKSFEGTDIRVLNGRYGPYITDGKKNARVPKDREPESITLEEATKLIEQAPAKGRGRRSKK